MKKKNHINTRNIKFTEKVAYWRMSFWALSAARGDLQDRALGLPCKTCSYRVIVKLVRVGKRKL